MHTHRDVTSKVLEYILKIIETSQCLNTLSLGCIEDLCIESADAILEGLQAHQAKNLRHLSLASVKDDFNQCDSPLYNTIMFSSFVTLTTLTIDYQHVTDNLLLALDNGQMQRIVIHVHDSITSHDSASNDTWENFVRNKYEFCLLYLFCLY